MSAKKNPKKRQDSQENENVTKTDSAGISRPELADTDEGSDSSVYDSGASYVSGDEEEYDSNVEENDVSESEEEVEFEEQDSSDESINEDDVDASDDDELEILDVENDFESVPRKWQTSGSIKRNKNGLSKVKTLDSNQNKDKHKEVKISADSVPNDALQIAQAKWMQTDNISSDEDEDGTGNRIGAIPLHWYEDYDHIGYDVSGSKVMKQGSNGDLLDQALQSEEQKENKRFVIHDALNAKDVQLTERQVELIRRVQAGAFAHPEFEANPDYIDYFTCKKELSGINSDRHERKSTFQPSAWEKIQVRRLLHKLKKGDVSMEYLRGEVQDMNDVKKKHRKEEEKETFLLWKGDEEDELHLRNNRPMHIAAPKQPPPGHAESYNPPEEYLPSAEELKEWEDMEVSDRPHGLLIPKKHDNLRSVGAYKHSVRERFERCLDLYLCPRVMKRRLNIDPESLVPSLPKAQDLRPFPTHMCIEYDTPFEGDEPPMIRCLCVSPDGQFMASGATDGYVRLWEVQTGNLMRSWNLNDIAVDDERVNALNADLKDNEKNINAVNPVVSLEWNPNSSHHCILAAIGKNAIIISSGTSGIDDLETTENLLSAAMKGKNLSQNENIVKVVKWKSLSDEKNVSRGSSLPVSAFGGSVGPIAKLCTNKELTKAKWHRKGDYFLTVSPKAGAAGVLIHQLSKAKSQQPFKKNKGGEPQCASFHPNKPFLFVATQQHVRIYHLVKQAMVKRLITGCRWISSIDVHSSGDHIIVGSLDRRLAWFDLDLSSTPYKTLK